MTDAPDPRTPQRIQRAAYYRNLVKHKDEATKRAVSLIVEHFVCPPPAKKGDA